MKLLARLPHERTQPGLLTVLNGEEDEVVAGPFRCRGKADGQIAAAHGNPSRDPLLPFGDTPTGVYRITALEYDKQPPHSYGPVFLRLNPVSGQAWTAAHDNGRDGFGAHGGDLNDDGSLRSTEGCLRVDNETAATLAALCEDQRDHGLEVFLEVQEFGE